MGQRETAVTAVLVVAALAWALGTPVLGYGAMIAAAPFFGELPTAGEQMTSTRLAFGAAACGFGAPAVGLWLALWAGRRVAAGVFGGAMAVSLGLIGLLLAA